jgi:hypothetical protein
MKKGFVIIVINLLLSVSSYSQTQTDFSFLDRPSVNKAIDTIRVKAEYLEMGKIPSYKEIAYLQRLHKVKVVDFKYALGFRLKDCNKKYYIPCRDKNAMNLLAKMNENTLLTLTIVKPNIIIEADSSFFYVDKVHLFH